MLGASRILFLTPGGGARGVLKGFCRLEMCFDIKDRLFLELVAFVLRLCPEI